MLTRRRFLSIVAASAAAIPLRAARAMPSDAVSVWRGSALGAPASLTLVDPDREKARALIDRCVREIERLEGVFSLYRADSAISRLNARGELEAPAQELVELLSFSLSLSEGSGGAFDPTVQPLYRLYADHFARPGVTNAPPAAELARAMRRVDFTAVDIDADVIRLRKPRMAITLNGVAQGFITDKVADLLRAAGFSDVLVDLGEVRALGHRADGAIWQAGIADPRDPTRMALRLPLGEEEGLLPALATSAGSGTIFGPDARINHLLDPHTGRSANHYLSVSVAAPRATLADGLSTALAVLAPEHAARFIAGYPSARAYLIGRAGVSLLGS